jgi:uncharacterized protein (DUF488 family)
MLCAKTLPTKPPPYRRQRFLIELLQRLGGTATATDLQKVVFLYSMNADAGATYYEFVPYKFGPYSFQLAQDIGVLCKDGYINPDHTLVSYEPFSRGIQIDASAIEPLRGNALIRKVYEEYPYYAIRSEIAEEILGAHGIAMVRNFSKQLENETHTLFSIGYEGKGLEAFISVLLLNGINLLCDVRYNPVSRKFGFSSGTLQRTLKNVGIQYAHVPDLGIESKKRQTLNTQDDYDRLFDKYRKSLPGKQDALYLVYSLFLSNRRIALMCYEQDPKTCHRTIIKDYLIDAYKMDSVDL